MMKRKLAKHFFFFTLMGLIVLSSTIVDQSYASNTHDDYYSLHREYALICWYYPTYGCEDEYRSGFKNRYDTRDSRILCSDAEGCSTIPDYKAFGANADQPVDKQYTGFRFYIAPGTSAGSAFQLYLPNTSKIAAVARFKTPPDTTVHDYQGDYSQVPYGDPTGAKTLEELKEDYISKNADGTMLLLDLLSSATESGWVYVKILSFDGREPLHDGYKYYMRVKTAEYMPWFEEVVSDSNFWDVYGDPKAGAVVSPVNHAPEWESTNPSTCNLTEGTSSTDPAFTQACIISATDEDNDTLTYSIIAGNDPPYFSINMNTGQLSPISDKIFDYESLPNSYTLTLKVTDGEDEATTNEEITINEVNVNEPPEWKSTNPSTCNLTEGTSSTDPAFTQACIISATDEDNDTLTYSIIAGNDPPYFSINMNTGQLSPISDKIFDYESLPNSYSLTLKVTDEEYEATAEIAINEINENDPPVMLSPLTSSQEIDEHLNSSSPPLYTFEAKDEDVNEIALNYYFELSTGEQSTLSENKLFLIVQNQDDPFKADLQLAPLTDAGFHYEDYPETIVLKIFASDKAGAKTATITHSVTLKDLGVFVPGDVFYVKENISSTDLIGSVTLWDIDDTKSYVYAIAGGTGKYIFIIDDSTGTANIFLKEGETLDYETETQYTLAVQASEDGGTTFSDPGTITINIIDVNDGPVITDNSFEYDINDLNQTPINYSVGTIQLSNPIGLSHAILMLQTLIGIPAIDSSYDLNNDQRIGLPDILYILQATAGVEGRNLNYEYTFNGDPQTEPYSFFTLNQTTGEITLSLDANDQPTLPTDTVPTDYGLEVKIKDPYGVETIHPISILITDSSATL